MKKFIVETYYTCTFKTVHTLNDLNDKELSKIDARNDGEVEVIDVKLNYTPRLSVLASLAHTSTFLQLFIINIAQGLAVHIVVNRDLFVSLECIASA